MTKDQLRALLERVAQGQQSVESALDGLVDLPFADLGFARVDLHRATRRGVAECVYGPGKQPAHLVAIAERLLEADQPTLVTRASAEQAQALLDRWPRARWERDARCLLVAPEGWVAPEPGGAVMLLAAGTSDRPVAEEARVVLEALGNRVDVAYDVGVAGLHRLLALRERLSAAHVVIAVAGMEGALASVVGGLVSCPVIAVPTSVGYGASFGGIAALLAMLNSCAAGVTVVNIDNGFGAAYAATQINRLATA